MRMSDTVAAYIMELLQNADGSAEIQRNELAAILGCVPSQINYVITSRFTPEQGYIVESRRGGGGYIRITRRQISKSDMIMHIVNSVGDSLDSGSTRVMLSNMLESGLISPETARVISVAVSDQTLAAAGTKELKNQIRASVFKNILLVSGR